jgi:AraC-like DNA-binding protein
MDLLTDVLTRLELKGWLSSRRQLVPPWRYDFAPSPDAMFHVLSGIGHRGRASFGGAYLQVEGEAEPIRVEDGDVLLFPTGHPHSLYDDPASPQTRLVHLDYNPQRGHQVVNYEGEGSKLLMLCGAFHFEYPNDFPWLRSRHSELSGIQDSRHSELSGVQDSRHASLRGIQYRLPKLIHIAGSEGSVEQGIADIVRLLARESASQQAGAEVMLSRLTELLFMQVIRLWCDQQAEASSGWIGALRDPSISAALTLIHQSPERRWKVEELAEAAALSRAAFSARFTEVVGEPPMTYLTRWRMLRATRLLKNEVRMETIADLLGYESEAAFRKAFKREVGMPPAHYRRFG